MFKKCILSAAILTSTIGIAAAGSAPYIGASLGLITNTSSNAGNGNAGNFRGIPVDVFIGYSSMMDQSISLAGELIGTIGTGELSNKNGLKTSYGYGLSVLPGVMLSDHTLASIRIGVVQSRFVSVNSIATGGQAGLAVQTSLSQHIDLRSEYDYTIYQTVSGIQSPRSDAFNLGLVCKFE